jgi:hypothetical protein
MIYVFSGLGADERVFRQIDWKGREVTFVPWITAKKRIDRQLRLAAFADDNA